MESTLYFRQLLAGRDFAQRNFIAAQMVNFVYLIGDRRTRECLIVDPAWDVNGLIDLVNADGMKLTGALATHYHPDHVGGGFMGYGIEGVSALLERESMYVHVHREEAGGLMKVTGLSDSDLVKHESGNSFAVGDQQIEFIHTPGHTPGSQCFFVNGQYLVSGDTLFVNGCGRVDLPGSDPDKMYESLTQKLAKLPDETVVYPGHHYGDKASSSIGDEKRTNYSLRVSSLEQWRSLMG